MAGTNRMDGAGQPRPHLAGEALASISRQAALLEDPQGSGHAASDSQSSAESPGAESAGMIEHVDDAGPIYVDIAEEVRDTRAVERRLPQTLLALPQVTFSSLVVQPVEDGVCLQGVLEFEGAVPDVCEIARQVAGVEHVLNQLVIRRTGGADPQVAVD